LTFLLILLASPASQPGWTKIPSRIAIILSVVGASVATAISLYLTLVLAFKLEPGAAQVDHTTLPLSVMILAAYVFYVARAFFSTAAAPSFRRDLLAPITFFLAIWGVRTIAFGAMTHFFGNGLDILNFTTFVSALFVTPVAKPALFMVAMVASLGPGFILVLWHLPRIMAVAAAHSYGAFLNILLTLVFALDTETRQLIFSYPLLVVFLCAALRDEAGYDRRFALAFMGVSLLVSRFYLPLNALGMDMVDCCGPLPDDLSVLLQFPWQWLLMNVGPYMGWIGYVVNSVIAIAAACSLLAFRPRPAMERGAAPRAGDGRWSVSRYS